MPPVPEPSSDDTYPLALGTAVGVELEYMIVDADTLNVCPIADELIKAIAGTYQSEAEPDGPHGTISWSNELALHVIELKTTRPVPSVTSLAHEFHRHLRLMSDILRAFNARLMPAAMHPWMNPDTDLTLWPHDYSPVYHAYDRIFSCRGHGWANLQSTHVNLPFSNDDEFGRLHAAIRLVLPILPALTASSPIADGAPTGFADTRIQAYRQNADRIPSIVGRIIPEQAFTRADYERDILNPMYRDIAPQDPDRILQYEWLNSRGCIARFDRGSIEIRLIDIQECPAADIAVVDLLMLLVHSLTNATPAEQAAQRACHTDSLAETLLNCARHGEQTVITDREYLKAIRYSTNEACAPTAGEVWQYIINRLVEPSNPNRCMLDTILEHGPLSRRILKSLDNTPEPTHAQLAAVYRILCHCLDTNQQFTP
ncbi:MAG: glutamate--cysteine ligase [Planctomycetes bacterium]|nr:glutamate--cysteine ligase [Planctomycetota bacterium]NOG55400.1 glutamate--cysteine ligase [Planctomycetota bacterium]